jgi:hypothetical protein
MSNRREKVNKEPIRIPKKRITRRDPSKKKILKNLAREKTSSISNFSFHESSMGEVVSSLIERNPSQKVLAQIFDSFGDTLDNPLVLSFDEIKKMRNDEQIKSSWRTISLGVTSYAFRYVNSSDARAEEIGNLQLKAIENASGIEKTIEKIMPFLDFGFFIGERENTYYPGSKIVLTTSISDLNPERIEFLQKKGRVDWRGYPVNYEQPSGEKTKLKGSSLLYLVNRPEFGNPYGSSELTSCYRAWWYKRGTLASWMRALERHGSPWILGQSGTNSRPAKEELLEMLKPISSDAVAVYGPDDNVELVQPIFNSRSFFTAVDYCDRMIYRSRLMPALVLSEGETHGSYALGKKHFDIFLMYVLSLRRMIGNLILNKIIYPTLIWNIGPDVPLGHLYWEPIKSDNLSFIMEAFVKGATRGAFNHPDMDVSNTARQLFDIPPLTEETLDDSVESYLRWYRLQKGFPSEEEEGGLDVGEKPSPVNPQREENSLKHKKNQEEGLLSDEYLY